jgi:hypothetical protein
MELWWKDPDRGKLKYADKISFQSHSVHKISHTDRLGIEKWVSAVRNKSNNLLNGTIAGAPMARTTIPNISKLTQEDFFGTDYQLSLVLSSILVYGGSLLVLYYSLFFNIIMKHML